MSSDVAVEYGCGWAGNDIYEFGSHNTDDTLNSSVFSIVATPAHFPSTVTDSGQMLLYDSSTTQDSDYKEMHSSQATLNSISFLWSPQTDATVVASIPAHIVTVDEGSLAGVTIGLNASDNLVLASPSGSTTYATSSNTFTAATNEFYVLTFIWNYDGNKFRLYIHEFDYGVDEALITPELESIEGDNAAAHNGLTNATKRVRIGQLTGTSSCAFHITNILACSTQYLTPPLAPDWNSYLPTDLGQVENDAFWVPSDGSGDDPPGGGSDEAQYVNSTLGTDHASFPEVHLEIVSSTGASAKRQTYDFTDPGVTPLMVGVTGRYMQEDSGSGEVLKAIRTLWKDSQGVPISPNGLEMKNSSSATDDDAWGYQHPLWKSTLSDNSTAWDSTEAANLEIGHRAFNWFSSGTHAVKCDQIVVYIVHGSDNYIDLTPAPASTHVRAGVSFGSANLGIV